MVTDAHREYVPSFIWVGQGGRHDPHKGLRALLQSKKHQTQRVPKVALVPGKEQGVGHPCTRIIEDQACALMQTV